MDVVGEHQEDVLVVLAREHGVLAVDLAREQRHALVLHGGAVERAEFEMDKVRRLQQLRQRDLAVVSGVGRVVGEAAVVVLEADEARVLDAVALAGRGRKEDALRDPAAGSKVHFVVRLGQQQDAARGTVSRGVGRVRLPALRRQDAVQVVQDESLGELIQHAPAKVILHARFLEFAGKRAPSRKRRWARAPAPSQTARAA